MRKKTTTTKSPMTVLHETKLVDRHQGRLTRIFEFNEKKFKLIYDLRNGGSDLNVYIMDSNGEFKFILNKYEIGYSFGVSYVSYEEDKEKDIVKAIKLSDEVISKIYG